MSIETTRQCFRSFNTAIFAEYGEDFLNREPTLSELRRVEQKFSQNHVPGCIGSIDCMHMTWKNWLKAWKGQYRNPKVGKHATIQVEGMCDTDLCCWHIFCGRPGTNNDVTVSEYSPLLTAILKGDRRMQRPEGYKLAFVRRNWDLYSLTDGIYPRWSIFLKPNHAPVTEKQKKIHESAGRTSERYREVLWCTTRQIKNLAIGVSRLDRWRNSGGCEHMHYSAQHAGTTSICGRTGR